MGLKGKLGGSIGRICQYQLVRLFLIDPTPDHFPNSSMVWTIVICPICLMTIKFQARRRGQMTGVIFHDATALLEQRNTLP